MNINEYQQMTVGQKKEFDTIIIENIHAFQWHVTGQFIDAQITQHRAEFRVIRKLFNNDVESGQMQQIFSDIENAIKYLNKINKFYITTNLGIIS